MEENKEEVKEFEEIELDWSVYVKSIESSINNLILQAFNRYGYSEEFIIENSERITIVVHNHDHIVYAMDDVELFAVHSEVIWDTTPSLFVHGSIRYEIVDIKDIV